MAGYTLAQAQAALDGCLDALDKVLTKGQSYTIDTPNGQRTLTRADIGKLKEMIEFWSGEVATLTAAAEATASGQTRSGRRTRSIAPG